MSSKSSASSRWLGAHYILLSCLLLASSANAHEYWIEPFKTQATVNGRLLANIKNGEDFAGVSLPRVPSRLASVELATPEETISIPGRLGDFPAIHLDVQTMGWQMLNVHTKPKTITYNKPGKFENFINTHGLGEFTERHPDLIQDDAIVVERYSRFSKALIFAKAADTETQSAPLVSNDVDQTTNWTISGQRFEWIVDKFPHEAAPLVLQLRYQEQPMPSRQVEIYRKSGTDVEKELTTTDELGYLAVAVSENTSYLINAVRAGRTDPEKPLIETDWASITISGPSTTEK